MFERIARAFSILGHPLLVLPAAVLLPIAMRNNDPRMLATVALGFIAFAIALLGWSWLKVRRGHWAHIDASRQSERRTLNRLLLVAIVVGAALAWIKLPVPDVALALALSAGIVALAMLGARWCKLSLHIAFAIYAAGLLWPFGPVAVAAGTLFATAVGWSRLRLSRHQPRDLLAGAAAGALAATLYWPLLSRLRPPSMGMPA